MMPDPMPQHPSARALLWSAVPAAVVGVLCALMRIVLSVAAAALQRLVWRTVPEPACSPFRS
jgi:hypothetical protein